MLKNVWGYACQREEASVEWTIPEHYSLLETFSLPLTKDGWYFSFLKVKAKNLSFGFSSNRNSIKGIIKYHSYSMLFVLMDFIKLQLYNVKGEKGSC